MNTFKKFISHPVVFIALAFVMLNAGAAYLHSQSPSPVPATLVQAVPAYYPVIPISATASGAAATLTLTAPPAGQYNYICTLGISISQNGTGSAISNVAGSSTNFNSWADKVSMVGTINTTYDVQYNWGEPATGCAKSTLPGTATTIVTPATGANASGTVYASYYQAP